MLQKFDFENEKKLFCDATDGDHEAFNQLYKTYADKLKSFITKMLKAYNLFECQEDDMVQETFMIFIRDMKKFKLDSTRGLRPCLFAIANNEIRNLSRKRKTYISINDENKEFEKIREIFFTYKPEVDGNLSEEQIKKIINKAIDLLSSPFRETFQIYIEGLEDDITIKELSEYFSVSKGTIKSRLSRSRELLKPILEPLRKFF